MQSPPDLGRGALVRSKATNPRSFPLRRSGDPFQKYHVGTQTWVLTVDQHSKFTNCSFLSGRSYLCTLCTICNICHICVLIPFQKFSSWLFCFELSTAFFFCSTSCLWFCLCMKNFHSTYLMEDCSPVWDTRCWEPPFPLADTRVWFEELKSIFPLQVTHSLFSGFSLFDALSTIPADRSVHPAWLLHCSIAFLILRW